MSLASSDFPSEVLNAILFDYDIPVRDVMKCRAVCSYWREVIDQSKHGLRRLVTRLDPSVVDRVIKCTVDNNRGLAMNYLCRVCAPYGAQPSMMTPQHIEKILMSAEVLVVCPQQTLISFFRSARQFDCISHAACRTDGRCWVERVLQVILNKGMPQEDCVAMLDAICDSRAAAGQRLSEGLANLTIALRDGIPAAKMKWLLRNIWPLSNDVCGNVIHRLVRLHTTPDGLRRAIAQCLEHTPGFALPMHTLLEFLKGSEANEYDIELLRALVDPRINLHRHGDSVFLALSQQLLNRVAVHPRELEIMEVLRPLTPATNGALLCAMAPRFSVSNSQLTKEQVEITMAQYSHLFTDAGLRDFLESPEASSLHPVACEIFIELAMAHHFAPLRSCGMKRVQFWSLFPRCAVDLELWSTHLARLVWLAPQRGDGVYGDKTWLMDAVIHHRPWVLQFLIDQDCLPHRAFHRAPTRNVLMRAIASNNFDAAEIILNGLSPDERQRVVSQRVQRLVCSLVRSKLLTDAQATRALQFLVRQVPGVVNAGMVDEYLQQHSRDVYLSLRPQMTPLLEAIHRGDAEAMATLSVQPVKDVVAVVRESKRAIRAAAREERIANGAPAPVRPPPPVAQPAPPPPPPPMPVEPAAAAAPVVPPIDAYEEWSVLDIQPLNDTTARYRLAPPVGKAIDTLYGSVYLIRFTERTGAAGERPYSPLQPLPGSPGFGQYVDFIIKQYPHGRFSEWVATARVGSTWHVRGPGNAFPESIAPYRHICALAGGVGVVPFVQLIQQEMVRQTELQVTLVFVARRPKDIVCSDELNHCVSRFPKRFRVFYVCTQIEADEGRSWMGLIGRLSEDMLSNLFPVYSPSVHAAISGPVGFTAACATLLRGMGFPDEAVLARSVDGAAFAATVPTVN